MYTDKYPCPACGFLTFDEPPGSYELCEICAWEDCCVQLESPLYAGGPNNLNLYDYQVENLKKLPIHLNEYMGFKKDPKWRPIGKDESIKLQNNSKQSDDPLIGYYWLNLK